MQRFKGSPIIYLFVAGTSLGHLIEVRTIPIAKLKEGMVFIIKTKLRSQSEIINVHLICPQIVGIDLEMSYLPDKQRSESFQDIGGDEFWADIDPDLLLGSVEMNNQVIDLTQQALAQSASLEDSGIKSPVAKKSCGIKSPVVTATSGNIPCKHTCADKNSCRHMCCREGFLCILT